MSSHRVKEVADEGSDAGVNQHTTPSHYESQKQRDWNTFGHYVRKQRPPVRLSQCNGNHVLEFLRYLDRIGKTNGLPDPPAPCTCPLRQARGSLDALTGRLRATYEENGRSPERNPFASGSIRVYLREVEECQAMARGIPYKKQKKKNKQEVSANINQRHGDDGSNSNNAMQFS